jgi:hypothetical protein
MESVSGTVSRFLHDEARHVMGFVLDDGREVRFWVSYANVATFEAIARLGSRLAVAGDSRTDRCGKNYLHAALITNLDLNQTASLPAPVCFGKPGMPSKTTPTQAASLAHHQIGA